MKHQSVRRELSEVAPLPALPETEFARPARAVPVPGLLVGRADDPSETRADARADRAVAVLDGHVAAEMGGSETLGAVSVAVPGRLHRVTTDGPVGREGGELDAEASTRIQAAATGGSALPTGLRRSMEGAFGGADFAGVRLHTGGTAQKLNAEVGARAFTLGSHIFLGEQTDLSRGAGRHLLAHELSHTLDNNAGTAHRQVRRLMSTEVMNKQIGVLSSSDKSSFAQLRDELNAYTVKVASRTTSNDAKYVRSFNNEKLKMVEDLAAKAQIYLDTHGAVKSWRNMPKPATKRMALVNDLIADLKEEEEELLYILGHLEGGGTYEQMKGGVLHQTIEKPVAGGHGFKGLAGKAGGENTGHHFIQLGKKMGISEAEVRAIRAFGADDYDYINPAFANIPGWAVPGKDDEEKAVRTEEGRVHGAMIMKGLSKLPVEKRLTFRGAVLSDADYQQFYGGSTFDLVACASSSLKVQPAVNFIGSAKYKADDRGKNNKEVAVFMTINKGNGRLIRDLTSIPAEEEVLMMPRKFKVGGHKELPISANMKIAGAAFFPSNKKFKNDTTGLEPEFLYTKVVMIELEGLD